MNAAVAALLRYLTSAKRMLTLVPMKLSKRHEIELLLDRLISLLSAENDSSA